MGSVYIIFLLISLFFFLGWITIKSIQQKNAILLFEREEKERGRIGRELHDGIGSMLLSVNSMLEENKKHFDNANQTNKLNAVIDLINNTSKELRGIAHNLIPETIAINGLEGAIQQFCNHVQANGKQNVQTFFNGNFDNLDDTISITLYRTVQELVHNAIKHGQAQNIGVNIVQNKSYISLTVEDDGIGYNNQEKKGLGLMNIKKRLDALGGKIRVESVTGGGTIVSIEIKQKSFLKTKR